MAFDRVGRYIRGGHEEGCDCYRGPLMAALGSCWDAGGSIALTLCMSASEDPSSGVP